MKFLIEFKRVWLSFSVKKRKKIQKIAALLCEVVAIICASVNQLSRSAGEPEVAHPWLILAGVVAMGAGFYLSFRARDQASNLATQGFVRPCTPRYRVDWTGLWSSQTAEGERCRKLGRLFFGLSAFVFATIGFAWLVLSNNWVTQAVGLEQHPMVIVAIMTLLVGETIVWFGAVAWAGGAAIDLRTHVIRRYEEMERARRHDAGDRP